MAKVGIYTDEYYPVYLVCEVDSNAREKVIELTEKELKDLQGVEEKWVAWQDRLDSLYNRR